MNIDSKIVSSFIGGVVLILFITARKRKEKKILDNCKEVDGWVIAQESKRGAHGNEYYHPVIKFQLEDGSWVEVTGNDGYYPKKFLDNQKVKVQYSVNDYKQIIIKGSDTTINIILLSVGLFMVVYSLFLFYKVNFA